jgi:hypothetical protein
MVSLPREAWWAVLVDMESLPRVDMDSLPKVAFPLKEECLGKLPALTHPKDGKHEALDLAREVEWEEDLHNLDSLKVVRGQVRLPQLLKILSLKEFQKLNNSAASIYLYKMYEIALIILFINQSVKLKSRMKTMRG